MSSTLDLYVLSKLADAKFPPHHLLEAWQLLAMVREALHSGVARQAAMRSEWVRDRQEKTSPYMADVVLPRWTAVRKLQTVQDSMQILMGQAPMNGTRDDILQRIRFAVGTCGSPMHEYDDLFATIRTCIERPDFFNPILRVPSPPRQCFLKTITDSPADIKAVMEAFNPQTLSKSMGGRGLKVLPVRSLPSSLPSGYRAVDIPTTVRGYKMTAGVDEKGRDIWGRPVAVPTPPTETLKWIDPIGGGKDSKLTETTMTVSFDSDRCMTIHDLQQKEIDASRALASTLSVCK
jgi:hypothetical protein